MKYKLLLYPPGVEYGALNNEYSFYTPKMYKLQISFKALDEMANLRKTCLFFSLYH